MSSDTVIADVGESLIKLLQEQMGDLVPPDSIALQSPGEVSGQNIRITLFLFHLAENSYLKNLAGDVERGYTRLPPLTLDLSFMLSAFSYLPNLTERSLEEHRLLGRAMRVLHDFAELDGAALQNGFENGDTKVRITQLPVSVQQTAEIWNTFPDKHYKPSVCYIVSPVVIDSGTTITPSLVKTRDLELTSLELKGK